jgi:hypothetical protein
MLQVICSSFLCNAQRSSDCMLLVTCDSHRRSLLHVCLRAVLCCDL